MHHCAHISSDAVAVCSWPKTLVVVSHARNSLKLVLFPDVTTMWHSWPRAPMAVFHA